ncbi:hypothetical protein Agub_g3703 [Astrephomene gubernaculifera]|uniref:Fe2OG dioxygenase domain-containing protein n=1 Tax=Astrephomene gubernaculifera TaxID=47775 RepID=A0AAD3HJC9_9CHLO|nr:hypothetical protein Agub_g3703 [Astrephomene gubernaculifera]
MGSQQRDAKWLTAQLSKVLGWDELIVEGLVDTVERAAGPGGDREELDEMIQNFMADSPAGISLINDFLSASQKQHKQQQQWSPTAPAATATPVQQQPNRATATAATAAGGSSNASAAAAAAAAATAAASRAGKSYAASASTSNPALGTSGGGGGGKASAAPAAATTGWRGAAGGTAVGAGSGSSGGGGGKASGAAGAGGGDKADDFGQFVRTDNRTTSGFGGGGGGKGGGGFGGGRAGSNRDLQELEAGAAGAEKSFPADGGSGTAMGGGNGKVLGMFKAGGRLKTPAAKPVGVRGPDGGALALAAALERQVVNCLGCGKIYDCRSATNDIIRFLDRGGVCTFCGDTVPLTYKDRQKAAAAAADATAAAAAAAAAAASTAPPSAAAAAAAGGSQEDAATAAAKAFKDRLVEYDRNAAKRTTVIDDQSDYFEIDTNAWLTDQEREEFRRRRQLEEEAEKARRQRLTYTIDLIGRKVVLDEDVRKEAEAAAAAEADRAAAAAKAAAAAAAAAEVLRNTDGAAGSAYGNGVAFSGNTLGGAGGPTREQLAAALDSLRRLKTTANPMAVAAASAAPLFLPTTAVAGKGTDGGGGGGAAKAHGASSSAKSSGAAKQRFGPAGAAATRKGARAPLHSRVQHDLGSEFDLFGAEVALEELMAGGMDGNKESEEDGPYDICLPDAAGSSAAAGGTSTSYNAAESTGNRMAVAKPPRAVPGLPPGVVLLKGYLSLDEQIRIVRQIRDLGVGPGGFYTPSYNTGARLSLKMMCMGLHWEPRTSKYETTRSSYDGAKPPAIPSWLVDLSRRCLDAASAAAAAAASSSSSSSAASSSSGSATPSFTRFPSMVPDICLANFYERSGKLGMHQDKDEMADSLRAGLPVVSLSIGDAADFLYGSTRDVEQAKSVRLESGDLLVFGGPGRMIFHSVSRVHSHTAPQQLLAATGLRPGRLNLTFRQYRAK